MISGIEQPDDGTISVAGKPIALRSAQQARGLGIRTCFQELDAFDQLTVAENIWLIQGEANEHAQLRSAAQDQARQSHAIVDWRRVFARARKTLARLPAPLDPNRAMASLSVGERQLVQLAALLDTQPKLLILDEPTSSLSAGESEWLFQEIDQLRRAGGSILYVSHRLPEIHRLAQHVTVLREGKHIWTKPIGESPNNAIVAGMFGSEFSKRPSSADSTTAEVEQQRPHALIAPAPNNDAHRPEWRVEHLCSKPMVRDASLVIRAGEVVGLYGLVGAGRSEFAQALVGLRSAKAGTIHYAGETFPIKQFVAKHAQQLAYLPEDRLQQSIFPSHSIARNLTIRSLLKFVAGWLLMPGRERKAVQQFSAVNNIRARSVAQPIVELSGGNQQKVVLGRIMLTEPNVYLLDEPTRGVDLHAKQEIHRLIRDLASRGLAVVLISSELDEVTQYCDRIYVFRAGEVTAEFIASARQGDTTTSAPYDLTAIAHAALPDVDVSAESSRVPSHLAPPEAAFSDKHNQRDSTDTQHVSPQPNAGSIWERMRWQVDLPVGLIVAVFAMLMGMWWTAPQLATVDYFLYVLSSSAVWVLLALAAAQVILIGGVDISLGSIVALSAGVSAMLMHWNKVDALDLPIGLVASIGVGAVCGLLNGIICRICRVHSIVVSLGTMTIFRGVLRLLFALGGFTIIQQFPESFRQIATGKITIPGATIGIPMVILVMALVAVLIHYFWNRTSLGRAQFAYGGRPSAARLAGISANRVWLLAFSSGGALAGLAGMLDLARNGSIQVTFAMGFELRAIAAAVLGGVAISGGRANVIGIVFGALLLTLIDNAIVYWHIPPTQNKLIVGGLFLLAVLVDRITRGRAKERA